MKNQKEKLWKQFHLPPQQKVIKYLEINLPKRQMTCMQKNIRY